MERVGGRHGFYVDEGKLDSVVLAVAQAIEAKQGFFAIDWKRKYLPEWNLPPELEFSPQRTEPRKHLVAAKYLWTCAFFERMTQSREIMKNTRDVWENKDKKWIFSPEEVAQRHLREIRAIIVGDIHFGLKGKGEEHPEERFKYNAGKLVAEYDGDPRNLIRYNEVEQARKNLMEFKGIGTGIANLFIGQLLDRELASPRDPENKLMKIDIHKGRVPINTGAVVPLNSEIHRGRLVDSLESAYWKSVSTQRLNHSEAENGLWVVGSVGCVKKDYSVCVRACPLVDQCISCVFEDENTGRYQILDEHGDRIETRKGVGQGFFRFEEKD